MMNYSELKKALQKWVKAHPQDNLTAHIIFTEDSFPRRYPRLSRSYSVSSDNKAFWSGLGGYSIFAYCLDGTDQGVRLDWYMSEEGNPSGWKVEDCYILEQMRDVAAIPHFSRAVQEDETVCYFFGDTCIRVREIETADTVSLEPLRGDQTVCGEWVDLSIDRVYGYCALLERHLKGGSL